MPPCTRHCVVEPPRHPALCSGPPMHPLVAGFLELHSSPAV